MTSCSEVNFPFINSRSKSLFTFLYNQGFLGMKNDVCVVRREKNNILLAVLFCVDIYQFEESCHMGQAYIGA